MKLLILTQKVDQNDDLLGFFHKWIEKFSLYFETVIVVCLEKGSYNLPKNIKVFSLGKERKVSKIKILLNFYKYIWCLRNDYDAVFVHMNPEYVVSGGCLWRLFRKKITLWYTHRLVDLKLKISEKLATNIITVSPEGFGLASNKIKIFGHGIDVEKFKVQTPKNRGDLYNIIYVGRISKIKNQEMLIKSAAILLKRDFKNFIIKFVGGPITSDDQIYLAKLKKLVDDLNLNKYIIFIDKVSYNSMVKYYELADVNINLCPTGGLDKAVLEAMAMEMTVLAVNAGFVKEFGKYADNLIVKENDEKDLADKLEALANKSPEYLKEMGGYLRQQVVERHNLNNLIKSLADVIKK
jgi:glycosyltransferase involved in cell wall biosynthesis